MNQVLDTLREVTRDSKYESRLYLVGGIVRDKFLSGEPNEDIDIVLEGDALELAAFLYEQGVADHPPVTYPRFGTAMISVKGRHVELVGARKESYDPSSRKPSTQPGTLLDDILRRDFTINTLLENLHSGEVQDLTRQALLDIENKIIRTPQDPHITFADDPLRMLRAVRFATRFGFIIDADTYTAICDCANRLKIISNERIREEFIKILMSQDYAAGLEQLRETKLLEQFVPELSAMYGVTQNIYHIYDVWTHTLKTLESIPAEMGITLKLTALLHDIGKVSTRTIDENGAVHFYRHQIVGAEMARHLLHRLKFSNSQIEEIAFLISMHLRVGEYDYQWSDVAVRRLLRDVGHQLDNLIVLTKADRAASNPDMPGVDLTAFCEHVEHVRCELAGQHIASPLSGSEIIKLLGIPQGPKVGEIKAFLESEIIEGNLLAGDKAAAGELVLRKYSHANEKL